MKMFMVPFYLKAEEEHQINMVVIEGSHVLYIKLWLILDVITVRKRVI